MPTKCVASSIAITGFVVLLAVSPNRPHAQTSDPNAAPNPYTLQENWAQLPNGRKFGQAIKVQVDHSDGKSIWVFDRCSEANCNPIQKFDANGKFVRGFGALYQQHITQADQGCDFDFLEGTAPTPDPEIH